MFFEFYNKKISAMITILPKNESCFDDEISNYNFPIEKSLKLKKLMGYNKHRIIKGNTTASELAIKGFKQLFKDQIISKEEINAIVYVSQSPDYFVPQSSVIMLKKLGFQDDIITFDINQGCAGFIQGLFQAFWLLNTPSIKKVALVTTDILSKKINKQDRNSYPLAGDGAAITIIENCEEKDSNNSIFCYNKTFSNEAMALNIPAGGFKTPSTPETAKNIQDEHGNIRSLDNLTMEGASVFSFVMEKVPKMICDLLNKANLAKDDINYFLCHQPNKFMLEKLADAIEVCYEKMPNNIVENFGNNNSVTIPTNICFNLNDIITKRPQKVFFAGFGVGLTLAGIIMDLNPIPYLKMIDFEEN